MSAIPDKWLAGFLRGHPGATIADAVAHWQEQDQMRIQRSAGLIAAQTAADFENLEGAVVKGVMVTHGGDARIQFTDDRVLYVEADLPSPVLWLPGDGPAPDPQITTEIA